LLEVEGRDAVEDPGARAEGERAMCSRSSSIRPAASTCGAKRQKLSAAQDTRRAGAASADAIHAALCQLSAGARLHPPQSPELTGSSTQMILNGAYLLGRGPG
jgi:hypothetical protein